jgi:hypothetical protein
VKNSNKAGGNQVGLHKPAEANASIENRNHLGVVSQAGGEKDDRNKGVQRPKQPGNKHDKARVVEEENLILGDIAFNKLLDLLAKVDNHRYHGKDEHCKKESAQKLFD